MGDDTNNTPSLTVTGDVRTTEDKQFQARVFVEKENNVYGAEVILFDNKEQKIDRILITDATEFDNITSFLKNIQKAYVPYTKHDGEIVKILSENDPNSDAYLQADTEWSNLSKLEDNSLESILKNKISTNDINIDTQSYLNSGLTIINATHLNGFDSSKFSKEGHIHDNYLQRSHENLIGGVQPSDGLGHVRLVDNLTTNSIGQGQVLSANQGRILNEKISQVDSKNQWSGWLKPSNTEAKKYLKYKVNKDLRLVVCNYSRDGFTKFKSSSMSTIELHGEGTIPKEYQPSGRVSIPMYRGDVTLYIRTNGSVNVYNLTKIKEINLYGQLMWHY